MASQKVTRTQEITSQELKVLNRQELKDDKLN